MLDAGRTAGAVYLAGYGVECGLKALILAQVPAGPRQTRVVDDEFCGRNAHSFSWLLTLGRRYNAPAPPAEVARSLTAVGDWTTDLRYEPTPYHPESDDFFAAVAVIMDWVEKRLN